MIDALLYAVRDGIRAAGMSYGIAECEITSDGSPPPRAGNWFVAIHNGKARPGDANDRNLYELYDFSVTLTGRIARTSLDRVGDQMIARNTARVDVNNVPLALRDGFNAKVEQLRAFLHMNWKITVLTGGYTGPLNQTSNTANDNLAAWSTGTVYGFIEPARFQGADTPALVGDAWLGTEPGEDGDREFALKAELRFAGAKRFQPQTASVGAFV